MCLNTLNTLSHTFVSTSSETGYQAGRLPAGQVTKTHKLIDEGDPKIVEAQSRMKLQRQIAKGRLSHRNVAEDPSTTKTTTQGTDRGHIGPHGGREIIAKCRTKSPKIFQAKRCPHTYHIGNRGNHSSLGVKLTQASLCVRTHCHKLLTSPAWVSV